MTDQQAIQLLQSNNERERSLAAKYILQIFSPMYHSIVRKRGVYDPGKNLLYESLVVLYQKVQEGKFKLTANLTTFLYSVCDHITLTYLREKGKEVTRESIDEITEEVLRKYYRSDTAPDINFWIEDESNEFIKDDIVRQEILRLGSPCQDILFAFYFHQVKIKDIAMELGYTSVNSAKQAKFKCLERLRKQITTLSR